MQFRLAILTLILLCVSPVWAVETKDIKFPIKNAEPVTFSHEIHLKKYNNNCKVCHNAIFNLKERRHFTMAEMEKTKSCGACHTGVKAFSVADSKSCSRCHKGAPRSVDYKVKNAGDVTFNHTAHVAKMNGDCHGCHNAKVITGKDGRVTMAEMEKGKTCGACHNDKKAFTVVGNCGRCHKGMKTHDIVFKPKGISEVVFSHDFHVANFACKNCHTKYFPFRADQGRATMADMGKGLSCGACHNGKDAFSAVGDCNRCHKGFKPGVVIFKTSIGEAKFSHQVHLDMYKCQDCHTKLFPYRIDSKHMTMHDMENGKSCGACHNGKDAFTAAGDCEKCHTK
ncbi:cytochrome c3 family protein [Geomonas sp.]|uniref:cytochrome c3 family protein n=1 Tax=Geomonas sp. TaxID=2651584 RepID=UPI002B4822F8|nr:cytochrome c3 family protein [Geomonas sp.]HJV34930.1 cytochrome c3 family protein [Geomonas sp.]